MIDRELRSFRAPGEEEAQARTWPVVLAAFAGRERVPRRRRAPLAVAVAVATLAVVALAALSPPGRAVIDSVREAIGVEQADSALFSLPAPGRVLVASADGGAWVAHEDGSKRRLGDYREASWSPFGRFVVAARANELDALEPDGTVRWKLARPGVRSPRWGGTRVDTRIAYLSGGDLRVVAGDGTGDRLLAARVDRVAPAWRPGGDFVLAYARGGRVSAIDARSGTRLWTRGTGGVRSLEWTPRGELLVHGPRSLRVLDKRGRTRFELLRPRESAPVTAAALSPDGRSLAFVQHANGRSRVWLVPALRADASAARSVFAGRGTFSDLAWSPDGRWLLVAWRDADQWLFLKVAGAGAVRAVAAIREQFGGFPALEGWVS